MRSPPVPFLVLAGVYTQVLPGIALVFRRNLSRPVVLIATGWALNFAGEMIGHHIGHRTGNSLWVNAVNDMVSAPFFLWAIADWQVSYFERLMVRVSVIPFLVIYGALTLLLEDLTALPKYSSPFWTIFLLAVATWTLLRNALSSADRPLLRTDWFYVLGGFALVMATSTAASPIGALLLAQQRYDLMAKVWEVRSVFGVVGMCLIATGALLPPPRILTP